MSCTVFCLCLLQVVFCGPYMYHTFRQYHCTQWHHT
jgi:hypothetical protein